jgi:hypothetical protein
MPWLCPGLFFAIEKWRLFGCGSTVAVKSRRRSLDKRSVIEVFTFYQRRCAGFAGGEFLSFASPKERNQRKGDPGSLESPQ